jgi:hypothetical protein
MYNVHISCEPAYYGVIGRKWSNDAEGWREEWMYETSDYAEALLQVSAYEPIDILDVSVWEMDALPEPVCQKLPECKNLRISIIRKRVPFKLPPSVLKLRNLRQLSVTGSTTLIALPPSLKLDSLFVHCIEAPYWLLLQSVSTFTVYVNNTNSWTIPLKILRNLLEQSLSKPGSLFWRWLTKGLYDPRLLIKIRDFLLYFSMSAPRLYPIVSYTPGVPSRSLVWRMLTLWWIPSLYHLRVLLVQGLSMPQTPFRRWLTKGLYDPRLLIVIRDLLLD